MKMSFTTLGCPDWNLEQIATAAKTMGYDGVELRTQTDGNHFSPDAPIEDAKRVGALFADKGVAVNSIMGYCKFAFTDKAEVAKNQELMRKLIRIAAAMKAPYIRTFAGSLPKGSTMPDMIGVVGDALKPLAKEANDAGVRIGMETHDDWCAGKNVLALVDRIGSPGFGIVYDIFNAFHSGLETWGKTYDQVKSHICYCHLKDGYKGADGKLQYVLIGAGELPLNAILGKFKRNGFDKYFSFEWEKKWHPEIDSPERAFPHFPIKLRGLWADA